MLLVALVLQASVAGFAPPLDTVLRVVSEHRDDGRLFRLERTLRFGREGEGYRAEVLLRAVIGDTNDGSGALYQAGLRALAGTNLVFHLDRAGRVTGIDDMPALWKRYCAGVAEMAAARRALAPEERTRLSARIAAPLRALPPERQRAMLASLISAVVAEAATAPGTSAVHLPGSAALGGAASLDGTRTVVALPGGLLRSTTHAASPQVTLDRVTDLDPRTGLIARNEKTMHLRSDGVERITVTLLTVEVAAD